MSSNLFEGYQASCCISMPFLTHLNVPLPSFVYSKYLPCITALSPGIIENARYMSLRLLELDRWTWMKALFFSIYSFRCSSLIVYMRSYSQSLAWINVDCWYISWALSRRGSQQPLTWHFKVADLRLPGCNNRNPDSGLMINRIWLLAVGWALSRL